MRYQSASGIDGQDWEELKSSPKVKSIAKHSVNALDCNFDGATPIREEVGVVCDNS